MGEQHLSMEKPIQVYLTMADKAQQMTAFYLFNEWWTRPAFVEGYQDIPEKSQVLFLKYQDYFACLVPMVGQQFKSYLIPGTPTEIGIEMTAFMGGLKDVEVPLYILAKDTTMEGAIEKAFRWLASEKGIRLRGERRPPEMFHYLGWCSWDAFYKEVSESLLQQKVNEIRQKQIPIKWMLIDDGWLSAQGQLLCGFEPDQEKFPRQFKPMIQEIKENTTFKFYMSDQ